MGIGDSNAHHLSQRPFSHLPSSGCHSPVKPKTCPQIKATLALLTCLLVISMTRPRLHSYTWSDMKGDGIAQSCEQGAAGDDPLGLLDDEAVAAAFVRDRLRHRPRGKARLRSELRAKGLGGSLSGEVVDAVLADEGVSEQDLAVRVAEGWLRRQGTAAVEALAASTRTVESEKARRRLYGHLARRGFRGADLRSGIDAAVALARNP